MVYKSIKASLPVLGQNKKTSEESGNCMWNYTFTNISRVFGKAASVDSTLDSEVMNRGKVWGKVIGGTRRNSWLSVPRACDFEFSVSI